MNNFRKIASILMLAVAVAFAAGCKKNDDSNNGGNNNGGGNNGGGLSVSGTFNGHDYVDLGLPSGTLWAVCNLGSETPEGYGQYFAWGETQPKSYYDWETYKHCMSDYNKLVKYCNDANYGYLGFTDDLTMLKASDDAASYNWGEGWQMPSYSQLQELYQKSDMKWQMQNGVSGMRFTGPNGNTLFLPAAGFIRGDEHQAVTGKGFYWSNELFLGYEGHEDTENPSNAWLFSLLSNMCDEYRSWGFSIRPVRSPK